MTEFTDITYEVDNGLAWITINQTRAVQRVSGAHPRRADPGL